MPSDPAGAAALKAGVGMEQAVTPVPEVPRRKGLGKKQIAWCRQWIRYNGAPIFAQMEAASKASKSIQVKK
jgi:hypothetical protein